MQWYTALLIGAGIGLVVAMPIFVGICKLYVNTRDRIRIKNKIRNNQMLITIDPRDFDTKAWADKINVLNYTEDLRNLNKKIFKKEKIKEENPFEDKSQEITDDFEAKVVNFLKIAYAKGYDDMFIVDQFRKSNYPDWFINQVMTKYGRPKTN